MASQLLVFAVLLGTVVLFVVDRWRYDVVAMMALMVLALTGVVPAGEVFSGFGNPAVITVAAVMIVSRALWNVGLVDAITAGLMRHVRRPSAQFIALTGLLALSSALISDVGALAVFMPVALQVARKSKRSPSALLMPMAFSALLGGIVTLVGTVPNILVSGFRKQATGQPFRMFDFTPAGIAVAIADLVLMWLIARWLVPKRASPASSDARELAEYVTEVEVGEQSRFIGRSLGELLEEVEAGFSVLGVVRVTCPR